MKPQENIIFLPKFLVPPDHFLKIYRSLIDDAESDVYGYGRRFFVKDDPLLLEVSMRLRLRFEIFFLNLGVTQNGFPIHKDGKDGAEYWASINYPLLNCDQRTKTVFYKDSEQPYQSHFGARFYKGSKELEVSETFRFDSLDGRFMLFNSNKWHQVVHETPLEVDRVMLAWRFNSDVKWEQAIEILQKAIPEFNTDKK